MSKDKFPSKVNAEGMVLGLCTGLVLFYFIWKIEALLYVSLGIGIICVAIPRSAHYVGLFWFKLGALLGKVTGGILMSVLYLVFLTPLALLKRISGKEDNFNLKGKQRESLFESRNHTFTLKDLENLW